MTTTGGSCAYTDYPLSWGGTVFSYGNGSVTLDCGEDFSGNPVVALAIWPGTPRVGTATIYWIPTAVSCIPFHYSFSGPPVINGFVCGSSGNSDAVIEITE